MLKAVSYGELPVMLSEYMMNEMSDLEKELRTVEVLSLTTYDQLSMSWPPWAAHDGSSLPAIRSSVKLVAATKQRRCSRSSVSTVSVGW